MSSNQNHSNEEPNAVPVNEQNELPANTSQLALENKHPGSPETPPLILETEPPMEVHAHTHTPRKKWTHYFWEFLMLFLAVLCGFFAEYQLEHTIERDRAQQFLQSMVIDVRTNIKNLDSLVSQDEIIIANHDSLVNWLLQDSATIDRASFAQKTGAVWMRTFLVRKETYEQMKSSGSLRYVGNIEFLKKMMDYERITNFAQYRNHDFEKKYYTDLFIPALYKNYDLTCQLILDTSNYADPFKMEKITRHHDVLSGNDAMLFRDNMGAALTLRLERLKRSLDAFRDAKIACVEMEKLILKQLEK